MTAQRIACKKWQKIIWREWHNCRAEEDPEYKRRLFALVANQPIGLLAVGTLVLLGGASTTMVGMLVGLVAHNWCVPTFPEWRVEWISLTPYLIWAGAVGVLFGTVITLWTRNALTWRRYLQLFQCTLPTSMEGEGTLALICTVILGAELAALGAVVGLALGIATYGLIHLCLGVSAPSFLPWMGIALGIGVGGGLGWAVSLVWGLTGAILAAPCLGLCAHSSYGLRIALAVIVGGVLGTMSAQIQLALAARGDNGDDLRPDYRENLLLFWRPRRPSHTELEHALRGIGGSGFAEPLHQIDEWRKHMPSIPWLFEQLNAPKTPWGFCFAARQILFLAGGDTVAQIERRMQQPGYTTLSDYEGHLLEDISRDTTQRLARHASRFLCLHCLAQCVVYKVRVPGWKRLRFCGCRICRQSRMVIEHSGLVAAILDANWKEEYRKTAGILRVNWHRRRSLFCFDEVEILCASDEDVERFCVQVANDTDSYRHKRYCKVPVTIASSSTLSENSLRILRSTFGKVTNRP